MTSDAHPTIRVHSRSEMIVALREVEAVGGGTIVVVGVIDMINTPPLPRNVKVTGARSVMEAVDDE